MMPHVGTAYPETPQVDAWVSAQLARFAPLGPADLDQLGQLLGLGVALDTAAAAA